MTLTPDELLELLAAVARPKNTVGEKAYRTATNRAIVCARRVTQNPALKARASGDLMALDHAIKQLEALGVTEGE